MPPPACRPPRPSDLDTEFTRGLGLFDATMVVVGSMIGSGIFIVSADMARLLGSAGWLLAAWVVTGLLTVTAALSYGELAAMMPRAGGQYVYLREAFSPLVGFLYGWTLVLVIQTGTVAAVAVAFARFLGVFWPAVHEEAYLLPPVRVVPGYALSLSAAQAVALGLIALLTWNNMRGLRYGRLVQNLFTTAKTGALLGLVIAGVAGWRASAVEINFAAPWTPRSPHEIVPGLAATSAWGLVVAIAVAQVGSLFASDAWNNVTFTAGEVRNPRRNLPLSLVLGAGMVIALYLLANIGYLASLPVRPDPELEKRVRELRQKAEEAKKEEEAAKFNAEADKLIKKASLSKRGIARAEDDRVATAVMERWSPKWGAWLMAIAIMISTFGCINGMILMGGRLYYAMARDGLFFQSVGRLNQRGVPATGMILQGVWAGLLLFSGTYSELLDYVIFAALLFYVLTVLGLFILRRKMPDAERPYKAFGYPVVPALYVLLCAVIMIDLLFVRPKFTWPGLIIVLSGVPVYFLWRWFGRPAAS
jgi:APA family basic amino acid/polyamine antiporter